MTRFLAAILIALAPGFAYGQDITTGLSVWLRFENNLNDSSGNGNNFTQGGTVAYAAGPWGQYASGINATNYASLATASMLNSESSYSAYARVRKSSWVGNSCAIGLGTTSAATTTTIYPWHTDSGNGFEVFSNNAVRIDRNDSIPPTNEWVHVMWVVESTSSAKSYVWVPSTQTLYTNSTSANCSMTASSNSIRLGHWQGGGQAFDGDMDDFRLYTTAKTQADFMVLVGNSQPVRVHKARMGR